jgi:outer membrane protein, heavy metal efflux system
MKMNKLITTIYLTLLITVVHAQVDTIFQGLKLDFKHYMGLVKNKNLEYAAQKFNVNISEAAVEVAKIFPDPSLSFDYIENRQGKERSERDYSVGLAKTFELGGKRKARINLAQSNSQLTKALLDDYFRRLQAEAALNYLEALKQNSLFRVKYDSWKVMKQLAEADSIRLKMGSIMEIDAVQSRLEAGIQLNGLLQAEAEWKNTFSQIALMTGSSKGDTVWVPVGNLQINKRQFMPDDLIITAQNNRADLVAALCSKDVAQKALKLARSERSIDLDTRLGYGNNLYTIPANVSENALSAGISIPLKFSNHYRGEIKMAQYQILQADDQYKQAELQIKTEISQAWKQYEAYCRQVDQYDNGLLEKAQRVRKGKIYSYNRGETSLLEVLNAQRVYNDTQTAYIETLYNRAAALVELEKAAGIWDISF